MNETGVTAEDVVASIEMILGRTPDPGLVEYHLALGFPDRFALGRYMINTDEFQARSSNKGRPHFFWATASWQSRIVDNRYT